MESSPGYTPPWEVATVVAVLAVGEGGSKEWVDIAQLPQQWVEGPQEGMDLVQLFQLRVESPQQMIDLA